MGKPDEYYYAYLDDNDRFADQVNGALFQGRQVVKPGELEPADAQVAYLGKEAGARETFKTIADKARMWKGRVIHILMVEQQAYVDYRMVLRNMLSESLSYHKQWKQKKTSHGRAGDLKAGTDEYFSGMAKGEKFIPVVTLVVHCGRERPLDLARCLHDLLDMVELPYDQYAHKYPGEMSGGQQQRIGILRALAASPPVVLMDEPFSALDPMTRRSLQLEVKALQQKLNKTIIFVTHDMEEALDLADVIVFMNQGEIVQIAPPEEMLENPATDQIREFLGKHQAGPDPAGLTVDQFMRTGIITVNQNRGVNECVSRMQHHNVDTLLVVDEQRRYQGTVSIADIRLTGHVVKTIGPLVRCTTPVVHVGDNAKECFEQLISSGFPYLVVLKEDETVAGIVTKTSMASAMAEQLWG